MPPLPPKNMNFILGWAATNSVKLRFDVQERCSDGVAAPPERQPHAYRTASRKPAKIQPAKPLRDNDGSQQQPIFTVSISGTPNASFGISAPCRVFQQRRPHSNRTRTTPTTKITISVVSR
jgi:hypothetical protein